VNAVPDKDGEKGCSWSRKFIPVPGWEAIPTKLRVMKSEREEDSFCVTECPEFEKG
jgi:hypothetical protein